ncbi:malonyl-coenzyme:anthocyanin 5-O-glucoside-6'''-O-malonyltransferase-like [Salvia miltiorrhiza]|uniref:malonyl-coenzyme:anthocyanin 5-O-glucoside-6'''-O-malonyltransferase-like n=1 Tax=Salvia miltiorrhiza TaxID=226208 RepID=UPI0025AC3991|nr:malonyl-coenzyme:anthocyanin 5-O-glucoside-6'''-O-malonyltransferase-like [Salvia miltiorrhiza]
MPTIHTTIRVPPPPGAAAELKLPLTFFDIWWVHAQPTLRLVFYDHPCSTADFLDTVVPKLKQSLSLTLKHFLPAAGNLLYPSDTDRMPVFRYMAGDAVPLTITESGLDFGEVTGDHPRDADQFYDFVPPLPPPTDEAGFKIIPLLALQVTLFPGRGLCIGAANHHSLGDARSIVRFISAWAEINRSGGDNEFLKQAESRPIFDRSVIKDPARVDSVFWNAVKRIPINPSPTFPRPTNKVRSTFILRQSDLKRLKDIILAKKPSAAPASSFVAATAYAWSCLAKSADAIGEKVDDKETEAFILIADARGRLNAMIDPPVPANYFGNCLGGGMAGAEHGLLAAEEGFPAAAEAIGGEIKRRVHDKDEFLKGAEGWPGAMMKYMGMRSFLVSDSPKFDLYKADFGWGKGRKVEVVSIDAESYTMSLCNSRDSDGGLEIGMSLPLERMEAFAAIFAGGLKL